MHRLLTYVVITLLLSTGIFATPAMSADELAYPRLAMWYPGIKWNTWKDAAQFDMFVGDFNETGGFLDQSTIYTAPILRGYNEDARLFTYYTNGVVRHATLANEMYRFRTYFGEWPAQWFLTEAGSTTAGDISAAQTTIEVSQWDMTGPAKGNRPSEWPIFRVGYDVLCGSEIMRIIEADFPSKTITVARGVSGTTAAAHPAGVRIAPIVRFWAGSYMMNLTASCPTDTVHGATEPENWGEYSFRLSQSGRTPWFNFIGGDQDGFMFDFMGDEISWVMWSLARSIDLDHDNVPDGFDALDSDWQAGIDDVTAMFRNKYPDATIIRNNSRSLRFDAYSGENIQNWPSWRWDEWDISSDTETMLTKYWHRGFFGEVSEEGDAAYEEVNVVEVGGIDEFANKGRSPNYTIVYSNEFETDLNAEGLPELKRKGIGDSQSVDLSIYDPNVSVFDINWVELFEPDYQKMRWGLCTALLAGSYYCYTIHSDGHGLLGLRWFDEYDGGGIGKGYLGQPVGKATQLSEHADNNEWGAWGREYSGGYVIVNPTGMETDIDLPPGNWRRIAGEQVPEVNSGEPASGSVTLPAFDGLILIREV